MTELSLEQYNSYVGAIYSAAAEPSMWESFFALLSRSFGNARVGFHCHDHSFGTGIGDLAYGFDPEFVASYRQEYASLNPYTRAQAVRPIGEVQPGTSLLDRDQFRKTRWYQEWICPQEDIGAGAGITVYRDASRLLRLSLHIRFRDEEKLQPTLEDTLGLLAPHLMRAFGIGRGLCGQMIGMEVQAALNGLPSAVLLVDGKARIRHANRAAEEMLRVQEFVAGRKRCLTFLDGSANQAFRSAVNSIATSDFLSLGGEIIAYSSSGRKSVEVAVAPYMPTWEHPGDVFHWLEERMPCAVVCVMERLPRRVPDQRELTSRFGLTAAETALSEALLSGMTLKQFAQARGVSIHTVRAQLGAVFEKTGVSQQSQLVALLAADQGPRTGSRC